MSLFDGDPRLCIGLWSVYICWALRHGAVFVTRTTKLSADVDRPTYIRKNVNKKIKKTKPRAYIPG